MLSLYLYSRPIDCINWSCPPKSLTVTICCGANSLFGPERVVVLIDFLAKTSRLEDALNVWQLQGAVLSRPVLACGTLVGSSHRVHAN